MTPASGNAEYRRAKAVASRAWTTIEHAEQFICDHTPEDSDYPTEAAAMEALVILKHAATRVSRELDAVTKACGVGVYSPYGSGSRRLRR